MAAKSLEGKVIVVTGAGRGIGRDIALLCAAEGAKVVVNDPGVAADGSGSNATPAEEVVQEITKRGGSAVANFESVAEAIPASKIVQTAIDKFGRLDGVVNNAGIRSLVDITADLDAWHAAWAREMQVNFQAAADIAKAALLHFRQHGGGHIVTMASRAGQRGYMGDALPYGATKAALINLSKSIARSFGHEGVVSIAVAPGWVRTEMAEEYVATHGLKAAVADIPIGRMAEPAEVGELIAFALRPSQSSLNGTTLDVNGGSYIR